MATGSHLKIIKMGDSVQGVRLEGNPKKPEYDEFRVTFPGGDVSITRCTDRKRVSVTEFEVIDHGIDGAQYFPGCGVYFSSFYHVTTGCGDTFAEALDDALESTAQDGTNIDAEDLEKRILEEWPVESQDKRSAFAEARKSNGELSDEEWEESADECDVYYYVSIRWNVADDTEVLAETETDQETSK